MAEPQPQPPRPRPSPDAQRKGFRERLLAFSPRDAIELFVPANFAFLVLDIFIAHSYNRFAHWAEWVPFAFSIAAPLLLLIAFGFRLAGARPAMWRGIGLLVGWGAVIVGVAGFVLHLNSQFFAQQDLKSLVYSAPFIAPLAYTGLGLLLILDRMEDAESAEWAAWVVLLALGGFIGNFVLSLADHAANGFYSPAEWISVLSAGSAVGFLLVPFILTIDIAYLRICIAWMGVQMLVGVIGFYFHIRADLNHPYASLPESLIHGAPPFAPLLFPNLAVLAVIGLWALVRAHAVPTNA